jgi:hypothetical protein
MRLSEFVAVAARFLLPWTWQLGSVYLLLIERLGEVSHRRYPCTVYFETATPSQT